MSKITTISSWLQIAIIAAGLVLAPMSLAEIVDDFDELETDSAPPRTPPTNTMPGTVGGAGKSTKGAPGAKGNKLPAQPKLPKLPKLPKNQKSQGGQGKVKPGAVRVMRTAPEAKDRTDRNSPITYKADKVLTFKTGKDYSVLNLVKNVFIRQGRLTLSSQRAKVYLRPAKGEQNVIDSITIDGNVQVQKSSALPADRVAARGDRAVFKNAQRTVVLTGNAVVVKGEQVVRGDRIRYDLRSGNIAISGAKGTLKPGGLN